MNLLAKSLIPLLILSLFSVETLADSASSMVEKIEEDFVETVEHTGLEQLDSDIKAVLLNVPRHRFVPLYLRPMAYLNRPLPIGHGQTISQPYIVALMTQILEPTNNDRVLEIGTGSGYQAAIMSQLVDEVFTVEVIEELALEAKERLAALGYENVSVQHRDGYFGWSEHSPYDSIIVTAAASHIPPSLIEQLKVGGKMIIPVGNPFQVQSLMLVEKLDDSVRTTAILPVAFVPFTRK